MSNEREAKVIITADNKQYNKSVEESEKITQKLNKALEKTSESATKITKATSKGLFKIGAAEVAGLTALSAVAATLEKQTSNIQANLALNKTSSQYNAVTASIRAMSREMPIARAEIASMATAVSGLGLTTAKQIGGVSDTFSKMGVATGESSIGLANSMVQFQRAMGVAQPTYQTMNPYANSVTGLSARAGTSAQGITDFAQSFAPAARVAGLNQSSVLGISTAASRAGVDGTYAASTISQILNDITQLRYVQSPELGRYARALGMDSSELTRKTTGPEDQDKFLRNIVSRVVSTAQSEEGPSRLSMMNIDGLRARKALQGLASDPGGIEKWINYAEFSRTQPNVQTGYEKAAGGLTDQTAMLRNRATDVGQQLGEPMMESLTFLTRGMNTLADAIQPLTNVVTAIVGKFGSLLGVATMGAGAILAAWGAFSKLNLLSRGVWNTGTQAMIAGARDSRNLQFAKELGVSVPTSSLTAVGQRLSDPSQPSSAWQRTAYGIGGGLRSVLPADLRGGTIKETTARGLDRFAQWVVRGTQDIYAKGRIDDPTDRYKARLEEQAALREYRSHLPEKGAEGPRPPIPVSKVTGVPLVGSDRNPEGVRFRDFGRTVVGGLVGTPLEATHTAGHLGWRATKAVGAAARNQMFVEPWREMRDTQKTFGMDGWARQRASGAMSGVGALAGNSMVQITALIAAIGALGSARTQYNDWKEKWNPETGGIAETELDNLSEYNEKLGLATRSLQQFKKGLDESNPARTDDIGAELSQNWNVRDFGRSMEELTSERLGTIKTVEQAKEWISAQGTMNADQWVLVMRDFSKIFKNNTAAFEELNTWVQENQSNGRVPPAGGIKTDELRQRFVDSGVGTIPGIPDSGSGWRKFFPGSLALGMVSGGDPTNIRGSEEFKNATEFLVGSQASIAKTAGETKDASSIFGAAGARGIDNQATLVKAETLSQFASTVTELTEGIKKGNPLDINSKRVELDAYIKAAGSSFGVDVERLDANKLTSLAVTDNFTGQDKTGNMIRSFFEATITEGARSDETLQAILENDKDLLGKILSGKSISDQLPDLTVLTSSQQAVAGTPFENVPESVFEKYLGEGSLLGRGFLAAGNLSDPLDFERATGQLVEFAELIDRQQQSDAVNKARTGDTSGMWSLSNQSSDPLNRQYGYLETIKMNNPEGTQGWNLAQAAQEKNRREYALQMTTGTSLDRAKGTLDLVGGLSKQLDADPNMRSGDLTPQLLAIKKEAQENRQSLDEDVMSWGVSRAREEHDWLKQTGRSWDNYYLQRKYSQDDFQRSMSRSKDSFQRQSAQSEAAFQRSLKYQQQDFNRSRQREEESYQRQKKYAAEDAAKSIGDPYNRMDLQMLSDPQAIKTNMGIRLDMVSKQNQNIDALKGRGLSSEAINQLGLAEFSNAQQTQHLTNTATDADIAAFNDLVKNLTKQGGALNAEGTGQIRTDKERDIGLKQSFDDFFRNLRRTKIEHAIQVKWNKKEFAISVAQAEEDHQISLDRAEKAQTLIMKQAAKDRADNLRRQMEDLFGFANEGAEITEAMAGKVLGPKGVISKFGGVLSSQLNGLYTTTESIVSRVTTAIDKLNEFGEKSAKDYKKQLARERTLAKLRGMEGNSGSSPQGETGGSSSDRWSRGYYGGYGGGASVSVALKDKSNVPNGCLSQVSTWLGVKGVKSVPSAIAAWRESKEKHPGSKKAPAGKPVYWAGGPWGHVALSLGNEYIRSTDWPSSGRVGTTTIDNLTKKWNKQYLGWAGDAWGIKLAEGGILPAKAGGHKAIMAEAGSAEMAVPLNSRGIDFMSSFTKGVAREMVRSMPKTPVSGASISNYDHSTSLNIETVEVASNDPKKFIRELQLEASKKRAALYKSSMSGVGR